MLRDRGHILKCVNCGKKIGINDKYVSNKNYHGGKYKFRCVKCAKKLNII